MRVAPVITLTAEERQTLSTWKRSRTVSVRLRERACMILLAAEGVTNKDIAAELGTTQSMVHRVWKANGLKPHLVRTFKES